MPALYCTGLLDADPGPLQTQFWLQMELESPPEGPPLPEPPQSGGVSSGSLVLSVGLLGACGTSGRGPPGLLMDELGIIRFLPAGCYILFPRPCRS